MQNDMESNPMNARWLQERSDSQERWSHNNTSISSAIEDIRRVNKVPLTRPYGSPDHGPWCSAETKESAHCDCQLIYHRSPSLEPGGQNIKAWLDKLSGDTEGTPSLSTGSPASTVSDLPDVHEESHLFQNITRSRVSSDVRSSLANMLLFCSVSKDEQNMLAGLAMGDVKQPEAGKPQTKASPSPRDRQNVTAADFDRYFKLPYIDFDDDTSDDFDEVFGGHDSAAPLNG